jgi:hypothetical protein
MDLRGTVMTEEDWRNMDWAAARGIAVSGGLPGIRDGEIVMSWKPPAACVALCLYDLPIRSQHVLHLLGERTDWRALDLGRTYVDVHQLTQLSEYRSLEFLSLLRRPVQASDLEWLTQLPSLKRLDLGITPLSLDVADGLTGRDSLLEIAVNPYSPFGRRAQAQSGGAVRGIRFVKDFTENTDFRLPQAWPDVSQR